MQHYNSNTDMIGNAAGTSSLSTMQSSSIQSSSEPIANLSLMRGLFEELAHFNQRIASLLAQYHDSSGISNLQGLVQQHSMPQQLARTTESAAAPVFQPSNEPDPRKRTHTQFSATTSDVGMPVTLPTSTVASIFTHPPSTLPSNPASAASAAASASPAAVTYQSTAYNPADDHPALILFDASIRPIIIRSRPQLSYSVVSQMIKDQWVHLSGKEKDVYRAKAKFVLQQEEEKEAEKKRLKEEKKRLTKKMKTAMNSNALSQSLSVAAVTENPQAAANALPTPAAHQQPHSSPSLVRHMKPAATVAPNTAAIPTVASSAARVSPARPLHSRPRGHLHVSVSDGSSNAIIQVLDTFAPRGNNTDEGGGSTNPIQAPLTSPSSAGSGDSPPDPSARSISIQPMPVSSFNNAHMNHSLVLPANAVSTSTGGLLAAASSASSTSHTPSISYLAASPMMLLPSPVSNNSAAPSPATIVPSTLTHAALPLISQSHSSPIRHSSLSSSSATHHTSTILRPKAVHLNASPELQTRSLSPKRGGNNVAETIGVQHQQQSQPPRPHSMDNNHDRAIHAELRTYVSPARNKTRGNLHGGVGPHQLMQSSSSATAAMLELQHSTPSPLPSSVPPPNESPATSPLGAAVTATQSQHEQLLRLGSGLSLSPRTSPAFNRAVSMPSTVAETESLHHSLRASGSLQQLQSDYDLGLSVPQDEVDDDAADSAPVRMMDTSPMSPVQEGP